MFSLGYDIGSSSIKCSIIDLEKGIVVSQGYYPDEEMKIFSPYSGWAEQDPEMWWQNIIILTQTLLRKDNIDAAQIQSVGISYQMHGLVIVDKEQTVLRPSIIWCDSRAVAIGNTAFDTIGHERSLKHLLNSPGNFTASKLRWVREHEPELYKRIDKAMLPGDFVAMKLTGEVSTTISGLSEGIFWDFQTNSVSGDILSHYEIDPDILAQINPTFAVQGRITTTAASILGLPAGIPVSYRAGDQPNNAFSLNVLKPGEIAATAGTSGVVYGVSDVVKFDPLSRVNPFAHVNHTSDQVRLGILLCINGTGILNSWMRRNISAGISYSEMNRLAKSAPIGSEGISILSFGNGAERIFENKSIGAQVTGVDFNRHSNAHLLRAAQEGIVFSFKYGMEIMSEMGMTINVIRAGNANMFLSPVFRKTLANVTGASIELFDTDGAQGAARGAAVGAGLMDLQEVFRSLNKIDEIHPAKEEVQQTGAAYERWINTLKKFL